MIEFHIITLARPLGHMCCNRRGLGCRKGGCLRGGELELAMPAWWWWRNNYVDLALDRKNGGMLTKSIVRLIPEPGAKQFRTKQTAALLGGSVCHSSSSFRYMLSLLVNKQCHQVIKGFIAFLLDDFACQHAMITCRKVFYHFLT